MGINCGGLNLYSETRVVMDSDRVTLLLLYGRVAGINRRASTGLSSSLHDQAISLSMSPNSSSLSIPYLPTISNRRDSSSFSFLHGEF